jgi:ABC-type anion transport system duplicated permease subunit
LAYTTLAVWLAALAFSLSFIYTFLNNYRGIIMNTYNIEITDTYGGQSNYSWVQRLQVKAKSMQGAISKASRHYGYKGFRLENWCGDYASYSLRGACIIAFITVEFD